MANDIYPYEDTEMGYQDYLGNRSYGGGYGGEQLTSEPTGIPGLRDLPIVGGIFGDKGGDVTWRPSSALTNPWVRQAGRGQRDIAGMQEGYLGNLRLAAMGEAPSAAELQQQRGLAQALRQQRALASSARGGAGAQILAQRQAARAGAALEGDVLGQAAILRAKEQEHARALYGQQLGQMRGLEMTELQLALQEEARRQEILKQLALGEAHAASQQYAANLGFLGAGAAALAAA